MRCERWEGLRGVVEDCGDEGDGEMITSGEGVLGLVGDCGRLWEDWKCKTSYEGRGFPGEVFFFFFFGM